MALMATWWSGVAVAAGRWWLATAQSGRNTAVKIEEELVVWWFFGVEVLLRGWAIVATRFAIKSTGSKCRSRTVGERKEE